MIAFVHHYQTENDLPSTSAKNLESSTPWDLDPNLPSWEMHPEALRRQRESERQTIQATMEEAIIRFKHGIW
jgi:hypothetical protein